jgi:hypothetical protein
VRGKGDHSMQLVADLLDKYQTEDPFKLSKCLGFEVVFQPLPEKIRSSFVRTNSTNYIVLNTRTTRATQAAGCANELGKYLLSAHREEVSYHVVDKAVSLKSELIVFITDLLMQNGMWTEKTFVRVLTESGVPQHIAEFLLNVWRQYKQRESGLYIRE